MKDKTQLKAEPNYLSTSRAVIVFTLLACLSVAYTLISNIGVAKMISVGPFVIASAFYAYALGAGVVQDCIQEIFGFKKVKLVITISLICSVIATLIYTLIIISPGINPEADSAVKLVLSSSAYITIVGWISYYISNWADGWVLQFMKRKMHNSERFKSDNWLWIRTYGSSIVAQVVDTLIFYVLGLGIFNIVILKSGMTWGTIFAMMPTGIILKLLVELVFQPVEVFACKKLKKYINVDIMDVAGETVNLADSAQ